MLYTKCDACDGNGDCWCEDGWLPEGITDRQVEHMFEQNKSTTQQTACNTVSASVHKQIADSLRRICITYKNIAHASPSLGAKRQATANCKELELIAQHHENLTK